MVANIRWVTWALVLLVNHGLAHGSMHSSSDLIGEPELTNSTANNRDSIQWSESSVAVGGGIRKSAAGNSGLVTPIHIELRRQVDSTATADQLSEPKVSYYGTVAVGTPPKKFNVLFDTGFNDIWFPSWNPMAYNLHYQDGYNCRESRTCASRKNFYTIMYRGTVLEGERYEDEFTFHQQMRMGRGRWKSRESRMSFEQNFLLINRASNEQFRDKPYDAVIGLSRWPMSETATRNILFSICGVSQWRQAKQMAQTWNQTESQPPQIAPNVSMSYVHDIERSNRRQQSPLMFGFWYNQGHRSGFAGRLTIGGVDDTRFTGKFFYHNLVGEYDWELTIGRVQVGDEIVSCPKGCSAILDTGVNSMVGPRKDVECIYNLLGAKEESGLWLVDCSRVSQLPKLTFVIEDTTYDILGDVYVKPIPYEGAGDAGADLKCYLAIKPQDTFQGKWILGTSFIGQWYTVFDYDNKRIGFAEVKP